MTDVYNEYRRKSGAREDPRLARRDSRGSSSSERPKQQYDKLGIPISPKRSSPSPSPGNSDPRVSEHNWQAHQSQTQTPQYNTSMQTAYQHLPASMYADPNQYSTQGYSASYGSYQQNYVAQSGGYYQGYNQTQTAYNSGAVQPGPPGEEYPRNEWAPVGGYANITHQAPSHQTAPVQHMSTEKNDEHKKDAVAQELKQQQQQMAKQREEYVRKATVLRRELDLLRNQKQELLAEHSSEHENNHILRENNKLQIEIQNKMKTIYNVIEMLTNIIGDHQKVTELEEMYREESPKHRREKNRRSLSTEKNDLDSKFCYIYYDPELHWCRVCDVFPKSAKDYLLHLHSKEHRQITQDRDMVDTPWHRLPGEPELPSFEGATKKRMPIKGLQFLISSSAWYCKLCDTWVGDLHCASQHLKSKNHNQNYANFVEQNPHWEIEWLRDRDKALIRTSKDKRSDSDDSDNQEDTNRKSKKHKDKYSSFDNKKDKKKRKQKRRRKDSTDSSSSSSSSDSSSDDETNENDKSRSIRVAMRNKMKLQAQMIMNEDLGGKWEVLGRLVEEHKRKETIEMNKESAPEDNLINQWMTVSEPQEKDKLMFDNLKDRMKQKQEAEKARQAELEQKRKEREQKEQELREKKEKEEREVKEKEEEKRRQQEELDRLKDKDREQIRFKTRDKYRRRSASASPERHRSRYSRSPSADHRRRDRSPDRYRRDSHYNENGRRTSDRRRSPSYDGRDSPKRKSYKHENKDSESRDSDSKKDKKMQLSSHKKPHFIGRMPLFKNKKNEDKVEKEIKKEDYDIPRQSRFQPGNLARAFIPEPEVVCFPKLSCIPPLMIPPPPVVIQAPAPPKISKEEPLKAPPPPIINRKDQKRNSPKEDEQDMDIEDQGVPPPPPPPVSLNEVSGNETQPKQLLPRDFQDALNLIYPDPSQVGMDPATMMQYQYNMDYNAMMYSQMYDYSQDVPADDSMPPPPDQIPVEHTLPLQPPPLPPDDPNDDLAMLGISADDMAAQMF